MDEVFKALADATRRQLLDDLNARNGQTLIELSAGLAMSRQAVTKHLAVLEAANLVSTVRRGREKFHYLNAVPINAIADRWITQYDRARVRALDDLKTALENTTVTTSAPSAQDLAFVYTTYINASAEQVYDALTRPEFTQRYWGLTFESDWTEGAPLVWIQKGVRIVHPEQRVLVADRPNRLSYNWHTFTVKWAEALGIAEDLRSAWAGERRSTVTFEIVQDGPIVKLTVIHDDFDAGSGVLAGVSNGWPAVLSSLKSILETGDPLPDR
jgi:DNA-binding transcriptional ArsR family regulator/uncharacterized protein YndB with AHSA1/START domain